MCNSSLKFKLLVFFKSSRIFSLQILFLFISLAISKETLSTVHYTPKTLVRYQGEGSNRNLEKNNY